MSNNVLGCSWDWDPVTLCHFITKWICHKGDLDLTCGCRWLCETNKWGCSSLPVRRLEAITGSWSPGRCFWIITTNYSVPMHDGNAKNGLNLHPQEERECMTGIVYCVLMCMSAHVCIHSYSLPINCELLHLYLKEIKHLKLCYESLLHT